jgi:hypothetical protein
LVFGFETLTYEQAKKEIDECDPFGKKQLKKPFTPTSMTPIPHENGFIPIETIPAFDENDKNFVKKTEEEFLNPKKMSAQENAWKTAKIIRFIPWCGI